MPLQLTGKQRAYVEKFVRCGDAYASALDAGYGKKRLRQTVFELRRHPKVQAEITRRQTPDLDRIVKTAEDCNPEFLIGNLVEVIADIRRTGSTGALMTSNLLRAYELLIKSKEMAIEAATNPVNPYAGIADSDLETHLETRIATLMRELGLVEESSPAPEPDPPSESEEDAPWRTTVSAIPPTPPEVDPNVPPLSDSQRMQPCPRDGSHPPYTASKDRRGRWSECPACLRLWDEANRAETQHWGRHLLPADVR